MDLVKAVTAVGAAATTFLVVGAATIEAVTAAVGGDIGPGIIGVFVGVAAALGALGAVLAGWSSLSGRGRSLLLGYAAFGLTILFLAALSYVNVPGADAYLDFSTNLFIAVLVAVAAAVAAWRTGRQAAVG